MNNLKNLSAGDLSTIVVNKDLFLEATHHQQAAALLTLVKKNREHLREWLPWVDYMQTEADFHHYIDRCKQLKKEETDFSYLIRYKNEPAGRIGLHEIKKQN